MVSDRDGRALALTDDRAEVLPAIRSLTWPSVIGHQNTVDGHECGLYRAAYPFTQCGRKSPSIASRGKQLGEWLIKPPEWTSAPPCWKSSSGQGTRSVAVQRQMDDWVPAGKADGWWNRCNRQASAGHWRAGKKISGIAPGAQNAGMTGWWISLASEWCADDENAAKPLKKRLYGILTMRHRVSNGNAEALNSKIRLLRIKARGYRNRERFKLGVMFHYGKLNGVLSLHHDRGRPIYTLWLKINIRTSIEISLPEMNKTKQSQTIITCCMRPGICCFREWFDFTMGQEVPFVISLILHRSFRITDALLCWISNNPAFYPDLFIKANVCLNNSICEWTRLEESWDDSYL